MFVMVIFKHACNSDIRLNDSRVRTPSPLREVVQSVKKLREFCCEHNESNNDVPTALKDVINVSSYQKNTIDYDVFTKEVRRKEDAEDLIKNQIAPNLLESIVLFQKNWVLSHNSKSTTEKIRV